MLPSGCSKSPSQKLIGRWYSGTMTIRFREDHAVIWNSTRGLALGRYEFSGSVRNAKNETPVPNLYIDVIRGNEREQMQFEVAFLGEERMRLELIPISADGTPGTRTEAIILRRAEEDGTLGGVRRTVAQR